MMKKIINYVKNSYYELVNKVSWPTRTEVINSSVVVLTASVIIALVILAMDLIFGNVIMSLIYTGSVNF
mgnify:CR=1 FL=1